MSTVKLGINPLPWVLDTSFHLDVPSLAAGFDAVRSCGFRAVHADVPADMSVQEYVAFRDGYGLASAPGYFSVNLAASDIAEVLASARRHARAHAELGLTQTFLAGDLVDERIAKPAVGAGASDSITSHAVEIIARVAEAMVDEGLRPALHPHVGTRVETEAEVRAVLDAVDERVLAFGPDTGHLAWAGMEPRSIIAEYQDRVSAAHIKDVNSDAVAAAQRAGADYWAATQQHHVWTEPGRGAVDLDGCLAALGSAPAIEWYVAEVDVPNIGSALESTSYTAAWFRARPQFEGSLS